MPVVAFHPEVFRVIESTGNVLASKDLDYVQGRQEMSYGEGMAQGSELTLTWVSYTFAPASGTGLVSVC